MANKQFTETQQSNEISTNMSFSQFLNPTLVSWILILYLLIQYFSYYKNGKFCFHENTVFILMDITTTKFLIAFISVFGINFCCELILNELKKQKTTISLEKKQLFFKTLASSICVSIFAIFLYFSVIFFPIQYPKLHIELSILAFITLFFIHFFIAYCLYDIDKIIDKIIDKLTN